MGGRNNRRPGAASPLCTVELRGWRSQRWHLFESRAVGAAD